MRLPKLSHLQFLVLSVLLSDEHSGRELRARLSEFGVRKSGPAFYQLMARLEDSEFVSGRYEQEIVEGQIIRERVYKIRASGTKAWNECRKFHTRVVKEIGGLSEA